MSVCKPNACCGFLGNVLHVGKRFVCMSSLNRTLACWPPLGPQDIEYRTDKKLVVLIYNCFFAQSPFNFNKNSFLF